MMITWSTNIPRLLRRVIRFVLPVDCAACGTALGEDPIPLFCVSCWGTIIPLGHTSRCSRCDRPFPSPLATAYSPGHLCHPCAEHPPAYTRAWTLYPYLPPLQDAICLLKYRGKASMASALARLMIDRLPQIDAVDLVIPVPLHVRRLREREFNQSLLLADRIARHIKAPLSFSNLVRTAAAPAQTTLSRRERLQNLRGAFAVLNPEAIAGKRILLIDDVFTTGTTVNECAKALVHAGSGTVTALTLARTLDTGLIPDRIMARRARPALGLLGG